MVTLIVTVGYGSLNIYAQKLSQHINTPLIHSDIYSRVAQLFNVPLISWRGIKSLWVDFQFIRKLNRCQGILHLPNHHLGRYAHFLKVPFIVTVHDLIRYFDLKGDGTFIHRPNFRDRLYLKWDYLGIRKAAKIIAVSHHTKKDLITHLNIPEEKISVIYEGIDHSIFKPVSGQRPIEEPYILYVGSEHPRKNLKTLLFALAKLKKQKRFKNLKLIKVGKAGGGEANFRGQTQEIIHDLGLASDVIFTGFVEIEQLPFYYSYAECFVIPSLYEGFGFPPLEAMACGCPVVTSNATSLPEVVGDAGLKVEPLDTNALAEAISSILTDDALRKELVAKGLQQASHFSWFKTAQETLKLYRDIEGEMG